MNSNAAPIGHHARARESLRPYYEFLSQKTDGRIKPECFESEHDSRVVILPEFLLPPRASKSGTIWIYCLKDPNTNKIRYVGKSIRPQDRLTNHMNETKPCHRTHWLQQLKRDGLRPILGILDFCREGESWQILERSWIKRAKESGWPLTNSTDGGDGVPGLCEESRKKMAKTWLGRKHKPETLELFKSRRPGWKHNERSKQLLREKMIGRKFTPEWLAKIAEANRKFSPEQAAIIRMRLESGEKRIDLATEFNTSCTTITKINMGTYFKRNQGGSGRKRPRGDS